MLIDETCIVRSTCGVTDVSAACSKMKLYSLTILYKGFDGRVKKLCGASDLASFGYFQRSR